MFYRNQKTVKKDRINRIQRVFAIILVALIAISSSPLPVLAAEISGIQPEFLEGNILTAEIKELSEVKPELAKTHDEERKEKIQAVRDDSKKWTERMVLGKMQRGSSVEDVLGKRKDSEKVISDLKEAGVLTTFADEITGEEKEIDPTLVVMDSEEKILKTKGTPYETEIPLDIAQPLILAENSEVAGKVISATESDKQVVEDFTPEVREEIRYFNWNANEVEGSHEENKILYRDLWESTDLLVTADEMGVKEDIILKNSLAPTEFNYIVETIGLELQTTDDGGFVFIDSTGEEKFYTPAPNITDAEGKFVESGVHYELGWKANMEHGTHNMEQKAAEVDPVLAEIKFNEDEGKIVRDEKSENEGAISGAKWLSDGFKNGALLFDGEDDLVEIPRDFEISQQLTLSAFVRSSAYQSSQILGIGRHSLQQDLEKGWKAMFRVDEKNLSVVWDTSALYLEQWYFLTATFDGENIRIFVNGEEENYLAAGGSLTSNDEPIFIGGGNGNFAGVIDEVQIFNCALSAEEVRELYQNYLKEETEAEVEEVSEDAKDEIEVVEVEESEEEIEVIEEDAVEKLLEKLGEIKEQIVFSEESLENGESKVESEGGESLESEEGELEGGELKVEDEDEDEVEVEEEISEETIEEVKEIADEKISETIEGEIENIESEDGETDMDSEKLNVEDGEISDEVIEEVDGEIEEITDEEILEEIEDEEEVEVVEEIEAEIVEESEEVEENSETSFFNLLRAFFLPVANAEEDSQQIEKFDESISIEEILESNESVESERGENAELEMQNEENLESEESNVEDGLESGKLKIEGGKNLENREIENEENSKVVEEEILDEESLEEAKSEETEEKADLESKDEEEIEEVSEGVSEEIKNEEELMEAELEEKIEVEVIEESEVEKFFVPDRHEEIVETLEEKIEVIEESEGEKFFAPKKIEDIEIVITEPVDFGEIVILSEQEAFAQSNLIFEKVEESDGAILRRYKLRLVIDVKESKKLSNEAENDVEAEKEIGDDEVKEIEEVEIEEAESLETADKEIEEILEKEAVVEDLEIGEEEILGEEVEEISDEIEVVEDEENEEVKEDENVEDSKGANEEVEEEVVGEEGIETETIEEEVLHEAASEEVVEEELGDSSSQLAEEENLEDEEVSEIVEEEVENIESEDEKETEVAEGAEVVVEEAPAEIEAENLGADVLELAVGSLQLAEGEIELSPTLTLANGTVLTYPLDLDPTTFIRLVNRGARTFAPNFADGNQHGEYSQTNNPGRINRGTEDFLPNDGQVGYWEMDGDFSDSSENSNDGISYGYSGAISSATNETNATITVADVGWVADEWADETFMLTSGDGAPAAVTIISNTVDTLTLSDVFTTVPATADSFAITSDSLTAAGKFGEAIVLDGVDDYLVVGATELTAKAVSCWIFANADSGGVVDFDGRTHSIEIAAGKITATGFDAPTIYIDGSIESIITTGVWHHVSITTATGFVASDLKIGRVGENYLGGKIDDFVIYDRELSVTEISEIYNGGRTAAVNPQVIAIDANGNEFLGNMISSSRDWLAAGDSLQTNSVGSKIRFKTGTASDLDGTVSESETATEIWAGLTFSPAGGIVRAVIDRGTNFEVVNEIDTFAETVQIEQKVLLATGLRNSDHIVELELLAKKNPRQSDSVDGSNFLFNLNYFETRASQFELSGGGIASTADTGTPTALFDSALTQPDDFWNGAALSFTSGDNNGKTVFVTDFDSTTGKLTFSPAVDTAISEETFQLTSDGILIGERATRGISATSSNSQNPEFEIFGNFPTTANGKTKKGSLSIWVSPNFDSDADIDKHFIFDNGLQRLYYDGVGDRFRFEVWDGLNWTTVDVESASQDFFAHENFHLAVGWDADSGVKLFVNGVKTAKSALWMAQPISVGDKQFILGQCGEKSAGDIDSTGGDAWQCVSTYFSGTLAEPQIWNYVLLDSEIYEIYNSAVPSVGQAHTQRVETHGNVSVQNALLFNAPMVGTPNDRVGTLAGSAKLDSTVVGEVAKISAADGQESNWIGNGQVGFWKMDGDFSDSSGNENSGIWNDADVSGQNFPVGKFNNAAEFDGVDDYLEIGDITSTAKAVSCWIYTDTDSGGIVDFDGGVHSIEIAAGKITATGFDAPTIYIDGSIESTITTGVWHHVSVMTATGFVASDLKIGRVGETPDSGVSTESGVFTGKIDDFVIYDRVLTREEIFSIYAAQPSGYFIFETPDATTEIVAGFDTGHDYGIARITIDQNTPRETVTEIDTYAATGAVNQRFLVATGLDSGIHTVKIENAGVANLNSNGKIVAPQFIESSSQPLIGSSQMTVNGRLIDGVLIQNFADFPNAIQFPEKGNISELQHSGTLEMWVTGALASGDHFIDTRDSSGNDGLRIFMDSADSLTFEFKNADSAISIADADFSGSFDSVGSNHILAKWRLDDSKMGMSLYLNGQKVAENTSQIFTPTTHSGIILGNDSTPDALSDFDGSIYDFAVYSHAMKDGGVAVGSHVAPNSEIWNFYHSRAAETLRATSLQIDSDTTVNAADDSTTTFFLEQGGLQQKVFTAESYEIQNRNTGIGLRLADFGNTELAQEFQIDATGVISAVSLRLKKVGVPSGDISIEIQTDDVGLPSGIPTTNGISDSMVVDEIAAGDYEWAVFNFATPLIFTTDTVFHLVLKGNYTASVEDYIVWGADDDSPEYSRGTSEIRDGEWVDSTEDFIFRIHENYPIATSVNAFVNGIEVPISSVKAGSFARLNDPDGITQLDTSITADSIQQTDEIPSAGFLYLGNPTGNLHREKIYYSSYSGGTFSGLKRGIDGTVPGNWLDGTVVEIAGAITLAAAPADGDDLFVKYNYSGDAVARSHGTWNMEHGTISFLDIAMNAADGWSVNDSDLVGYWKMDGDFTDSSGNENSGTWNDADESEQNFPNGKFNSAAEFDGVDDYLVVGATGLTAKAVSCWIYADGDSSGIVDFGGGHLIKIAAGKIVATGFDAPTIFVDGFIESIITTGAWHHISITSATGFVASDLKIGMISDVKTPESGVSTESGVFTGKIDDFAIYSRELSVEEISRLHSEGVSTHSKNTSVAGQTAIAKLRGSEISAVIDFSRAVGGVSQFIIDEGTVGERRILVDSSSETSLEKIKSLATNLSADILHTVRFISGVAAGVNSVGIETRLNAFQANGHAPILTPAASSEIVWAEPVADLDPESTPDNLINLENAIGGNDSYTKLLIHSDTKTTPTTFLDSSVSAHTITASGDAHHFAPKFGESSIHLDGVVDSISAADSTDWDFEAGDFSIDFWINFSDLTEAQILAGQYSDAENFWQIQKDSAANGDKLKLKFISNGIAQADYEMENPWSVSANSWHHLAFIRISESAKIFVDGVSQTLIETVAFSENFAPDIAAPLIFGSQDSTKFFDGYMDEIRISKGVARWTEDFTPPVEASLADVDTQLLIHSDTKTTPTTFLDSSVSAHTITASGDAHHFAPKFGESSIHLDGVVDSISAADSTDWDFEAGDFSIDFWINFSDLTEAQILAGQYSDAENFWQIQKDSAANGDKLKLKFISNGIAQADYEMENPWSVSANSWHHLAFIRISESAKIFVDGVSQTLIEETAFAENSALDLDTPLIFGSQDSTKFFDGYMDEIRISKGVARWTEDFTVLGASYDIDIPTEEGEVQFDEIEGINSNLVNDVKYWNTSQQLAVGSWQLAELRVNLLEDLTSSATEAVVERVEHLPNAGVIKIENEYIKYGAKGSDGVISKLLNLQRGYDNYTNSTAAAHAISDSEEIISGFENVNDVFIYDTSKDSIDGGWRFDAATSWYSENFSPTRCPNGFTDSGSQKCTRAFPEVAVIVATDSDLKIYDAESRELWVAASQENDAALGADAENNPTAVFALDGEIYIANNGGAASGLHILDFTADQIRKIDAIDDYLASGDISQRNSLAEWGASSLAPIIDSKVNDVHEVTISEKTYIAVATDSGVSVINRDGVGSGAVHDYADTALDAYSLVRISEGGELYAFNETLAQIERWDAVHLDSADEIAGTPDMIYDENSTPTLNNTSVSSLEISADKIYLGTAGGVNIISEKIGDEANGSVKYLTADSVESLAVVGSSLFIATDSVISKINLNSDTSIQTIDSSSDFGGEEIGILNPLAISANDSGVAFATADKVFIDYAEIQTVGGFSADSGYWRENKEASWYEVSCLSMEHGTEVQLPFVDFIARTNTTNNQFITLHAENNAKFVSDSETVSPVRTAHDSLCQTDGIGMSTNLFEFSKNSLTESGGEFNKISFRAFGEYDSRLAEADSDFFTSRQSFVGPEKSLSKLAKKPGLLASNSSVTSSKSDFLKTTYSEPMVLTMGTEDRDLEGDSTVEQLNSKSSLTISLEKKKNFFTDFFIPTVYAGLFCSGAFPEKVYIVAREEGVSIVDSDSNSLWMNFIVGEGNVLDSRVKAVEHSADSIFIATESGVIRLDFAADEITKFVGQEEYSAEACSDGGSVDFSDVNDGNFCFSEIQPSGSTLRVEAETLDFTANSDGSSFIVFGTKNIENPAESKAFVLDLACRGQACLTPTDDMGGAITATHFDSAGNLFIATDSRISKISATTETPDSTTETPDSGVSTDSDGIDPLITKISDITDDGTNLFVATNIGVEKLNIETLQRVETPQRGVSTTTGTFLTNTDGENNLLAGSTNEVSAVDFMPFAGGAEGGLLAVGTTDGKIGSGAVSIIENLQGTPQLDQSMTAIAAGREGLAGDIITSFDWAFNYRDADEIFKWVLLVGSQDGFSLVDDPDTDPNAPTLISPVSGWKTTDTTPTLSANYSDVDVEDIGTTNYRVATSAADCLSGTSLTSSGVSALTATNSEATTWSSTAIAADGTYYWCAQNNDETLTSDWTSMGSIILDTTTPDIVTVYAGPSSLDRTSFTSDTQFSYATAGSDGQVSFGWTDPASTSDDEFYYALIEDPEVARNNLVGWWKLEEEPDNSTGQIQDLSGYNTDGTSFNMAGTESTAGVIDKAISFDGVDDYIDAGSTGLTAKAVCCWIYADNDTRDIVDFDGGTHSIEVSAGTVTATGFASPTIYVDGSESSTITTGAWHHISITTATGFTASALKIGSIPTSGVATFDGKIDDVKIWNTALTETQIQQEYSRGKALHLDDGLVGWWKLNELPDGTSGEMRDSSSSGNHGDTAGSMTSADSVAGKMGTALEFDGVDDYVDVGSTGQTAKAVCCWVYADNDTRDIVDFDGGTHSIAIDPETPDSGVSTVVATGFVSPTIYVDGVESATITTGVWHHISITTATGFTASALKIGSIPTSGVATLDGIIDDVRIYNRVISESEIATLYRTRVTTDPFLDDFLTDYPADDSADTFPNHTSYLHVRPITGSDTWGTERSFTAAYDGDVPTIASNSMKIYETDAITEIVEGGTIVNKTAVKFLPEATSYDSAAAVITVFENLNTDESAFSFTTAPTTEDADGLGNPACVSGTTYADCASKVWYEMSSAGDYSATAFDPTIEVTGLTVGDYKARAIASNTSMPNVAADYGAGESSGWWSVHHSDTGEGAFYSSGYLKGWAFSENAGWIKLYFGSPTESDCSAQPMQTTTDYGVMHDGSGNLCGYGYSETFGWISFMGDNYQVFLTDDHQISGHALSETIGWVSFTPSDDLETPNLCLFDSALFGCRFDGYTYEAGTFGQNAFGEATFQ